MTGEITSASAQRTPALSARGEWGRYIAFLKAPRLPQEIEGGRVALVGTARIAALDLIIMTVLIGVLLTIVAMGIELPENLNSTLEMNLTTVLLVVLLAPLIEELVFRSWLSGRPAILAPAALLLIGVAAIPAIMLAGGVAQGSPALLVGPVLGIGAAIAAVIVFRGRSVPAWFRAAFPAFFWLSSIAFALIHLFNYTEGTLAILLPLVVPQLILGTMAAHVRVHFGLIWAILLHAAHNSFALSIAALAMKAGVG